MYDFPVCVYRLVTALSEWLSAGGLFIVAGCLASIATLIVVLAVAVCLVRSRRRRRRKTTSTTKVELHEDAPPTSDPLTAPLRDPLLAAEMGQLADVTLTELESEPVRYVVGHERSVLCSLSQISPHLS